MAYLTLQYSDNLVKYLDFEQICGSLRLIMLDQKIFPEAGVRVKAYPISSYSVADGHSENAFIDRIAFGNGATSVDTAGKILYKTPKVNEAYENSAGLYSRTFAKRLNPSTTDTSISTVVGSSHTDIKVTCTLGYNEPSDADLFDTATNNEGNYVFDELGLFTYPTDGSNIDTSTMLTHVIFHPVQKSQNRKIEIVYTVRVQLS